MFQTLKNFAPAAVVALLGSLVMLPAPGQDAQEQSGVSPTAGTFSYKAGPVKSKVARTQTAATVFNESATWLSLPGATLTLSVPATQSDGDLLNVAFSAECRVFNGGTDDYLRIRILDNGAPIEPYDGEQAFCSADSYATHKGNWVKRASPGNHTLQVQFWIYDGAPVEAVAASIDDWTFEAVVYD